MPTSIKSVGTYVPAGVLTNADLEKMVETSDTWIRERTVRLSVCVLLAT